MFHERSSLPPTTRSIYGVSTCATPEGITNWAHCWYRLSHGNWGREVVTDPDLHRAMLLMVEMSCARTCGTAITLKEGRFNQLSQAVGLAVCAAHVRLVPDEAFVEAARAVVEQVMAE